MTSPTDVANRALGEVGAQTLIAELEDEDSQAAAYCRLYYTPIRQELLRSAPWGFARKTLSLTQLGALINDPADSPFPWLVKYAYPADCLKMRYVLAPPIPVVVQPSDVPPDVSEGLTWAAPWCMPRRDWRYLVSYDDTVVPSRRVLVANIAGALGVYTADVTNPNLWDSLFTNALVMALADKLVIPLSGNVGMKTSFVQLVDRAIIQARVADGNESIPSTDHSVDWIETRGIGNAYPSGTFNGTGYPMWGTYYSGYDGGSWGM